MISDTPTDSTIVGPPASPSLAQHAGAAVVTNEPEPLMITPMEKAELLDETNKKLTLRERAKLLFHQYKPLIGTALFFAAAGIIPSLTIAFAQEAVFDLIHAIVAQGVVGKLLYVLFLVVWTVVCFPTTIAELLCGFTFGFGTSVIVSMAGKTLGSIVSFLIGKYAFRSWIQERIAGRYPVMKALQRAVVQKPWQIIFLTRLAMLPIALKNYGVSVMPDIKLWVFSVCTLIGGIPFTVAWSYFGSASSDLVAVLSESSTNDSQKTVKTVLTVMGVVALVGVLIALRFYTKKQLAIIQAEQALEESGTADTTTTKKSAA